MSVCANNMIVVLLGADDLTIFDLSPSDVAAADMGAWWSSITRVTATFGGATLDSQSAAAGTFDWADQALKIRMGRASGVPAGYFDLRLKIYTPATPNGLGVWHNLPRVRVVPN